MIWHLVLLSATRHQVLTTTVLLSLCEIFCFHKAGTQGKMGAEQSLLAARAALPPRVLPLDTKLLASFSHLPIRRRMKIFDEKKWSERMRQRKTLSAMETLRFSLTGELETTLDSCRAQRSRRDVCDRSIVCTFLYA